MEAVGTGEMGEGHRGLRGRGTAEVPMGRAGEHHEGGSKVLGTEAQETGAGRRETPRAGASSRDARTPGFLLPLEGFCVHRLPCLAASATSGGCPFLCPPPAPSLPPSVGLFRPYPSVQNCQTKLLKKIYPINERTQEGQNGSWKGLGLAIPGGSPGCSLCQQAPCQTLPGCLLPWCPGRAQL